MESASDAEVAQPLITVTPQPWPKYSKVLVTAVIVFAMLAGGCAILYGSGAEKGPSWRRIQPTITAVEDVVERYEVTGMKCFTGGCQLVKPLWLNGEKGEFTKEKYGTLSTRECMEKCINWGG